MHDLAPLCLLMFACDGGTSGTVSTPAAPPTAAPTGPTPSKPGTEPSTPNPGIAPPVTCPPAAPDAGTLVLSTRSWPNTARSLAVGEIDGQPAAWWWARGLWPEQRPAELVELRPGHGLRVLSRLPAPGADPATWASLPTVIDGVLRFRDGPQGPWRAISLVPTDHEIEAGPYETAPCAGAPAHPQALPGGASLWIGADGVRMDAGMDAGGNDAAGLPTTPPAEWGKEALAPLLGTWLSEAPDDRRITLYPAKQGLAWGSEVGDDAGEVNFALFSGQSADTLRFIFPNTTEMSEQRLSMDGGVLVVTGPMDPGRYRRLPR